MLSLVRDADGSYPLVYGTIVDAAGATRRLDRDAFEVQVTDHWTSPATGATYPAGWRVTIPGEGLAIDLHPTVADQELDTRASTGVVYWEGSQVVSATRGGHPAGRRGLCRADRLRALERGGQLGQGVSGCGDRDARAGGDVVELGVERGEPAEQR